MITALLVLAFSTPLVVLACGRCSRSRWSLFPATLPALIAGLSLPPGTSIQLDWFLLGATLGIDAVTSWLLPAAALVWSGAAVQHATAFRDVWQGMRFRVFFLLAMAGNFLLLLAGDVITFYVGYGVMGLSAYGLVLSDRSLSAVVASRSYLRWTIAGELLLFAGLASLVHQAGSLQLAGLSLENVAPVSLLLVLAGLGIKIGLPGLHAWMPGAYTACPTPGSMVLSGAMINAGVLGLLRFLPLQEPGYAAFGQLLLGFGLLGAFYGVAFGLWQRNPKTILAYSSISQMGTLAAMLGLALTDPALSLPIVAAVTVYAVHHGLTKASLFLAVDVYKQGRVPRIATVMLLVLSLVLAGAPYSSGAVAKSLLKEVVSEDHIWLGTVLFAAGVSTTLLMVRFLFSVRRLRLSRVPSETNSDMWVVLALLVGGHLLVYQTQPLPPLSLQSAWPLAVGIAAAFAFTLLPQHLRTAIQPVVPKGDLPRAFGNWLLRHLPVRRAAAMLSSPARDGTGNVLDIRPAYLVDRFRSLAARLHRHLHERGIQR